MNKKIEFTDLSLPLQIAIVGGWIYAVLFALIVIFAVIGVVIA